MGWFIALLIISLLVFIIFIMFIYYSNDKNERLMLLFYLLLDIVVIVMSLYCLNELKCFAKTSCKEYSVETIVTQFENKSDTTYVLHLKR